MPEQPESQAAEAFEEPPREEIPGISRGHVQYMESSDADDVWCIAGMHHVILHTIGRKSGNEHKVALPYWVDRDGHRIVVASFSGAPDHPSWYLNLSDRDANPEVKIRVFYQRDYLSLLMKYGLEPPSQMLSENGDAPPFWLAEPPAPPVPKAERPSQRPKSA